MKILLFGIGYWGKNHIKTLSQLNVLSGIVEQDKATLKMFLKKYPGVNGHSNIEEALVKDYDGYTIATPAKTHYEIAKIISNVFCKIPIKRGELEDLIQNNISNEPDPYFRRYWEPKISLQDGIKIISKHMLKSKKSD